MQNTTYPIGREGKKWQQSEREQWRSQTSIKRSYQEEVVSKIAALSNQFDVEPYGRLSYDTERYPVFSIRSKVWSAEKPNVLITGGVHGYETSGIHGALEFVNTQMTKYSKHFNIMVVPCVSPWGYETINRWNPLALDPNRSFYSNSPAEESALLISLVNTLGDVFVHIDLHETTDTDESEFRPALAARDGLEYVPGTIPDGFYTVGDTEKPQAEFQAAVINSVSQVTHIAPADGHNQIIGSPVTQHGVINYPMKKLGLCGGITNCMYSTTTEVYPDSPKVNDEECNQAQVAAIVGGLDYALSNLE
jgi:hypothetical protein